MHDYEKVKINPELIINSKKGIKKVPKMYLNHCYVGKDARCKFLWIFNKIIFLKNFWKEQKTTYLNISPSFSTGGVPFRVCEFAAAFAPAEFCRFVESCKDEFRAESGVFLSRSRNDCRTSPEAIDIRGLRLLTICNKNQFRWKIVKAHYS